jgi:hypothetical protein
MVTEMLAGPSKVPCRVMAPAGSLPAPQNPPNVGATANALPISRPGTAAASMPPPRPIRVRRSTRPSPTAITASDHRFNAPDRICGSRKPRSAATTGPPMATRKIPA